jgi:glutamine synthetase
MNQINYTDFRELTYNDLKLLNQNARQLRDEAKAKETHTKFLAAEDNIKAVTVCFSDIEGRLHMLDYDKNFFLDSLDSLTFDGSSIHGLSELKESDLRLQVDWTSLTFVPADVFGAGKVIIFANVCDRDFKPYQSDFRNQLQTYTDALRSDQNIEVYMAPEIEGILLAGVDAEQNYDSKAGFDLVSSGGYFHSLPLDDLRRFIDKTAEVQRAMGFNNEKDHPEVAPSQFEINFHYTDVVRACDQIQLYKLVCRQVAMSMGMTATFLPKPLAGINGNGMHVNISLSKNNKNIFYGNGQPLSKAGHEFVEKILNRAQDLCLTLNSSVNSYRRLDPNFEAPNQIKVSANDRSSMVRIPFANERSARVEVRSVSPDANPYLALFVLIKTGVDDEKPKAETGDKRQRLRFLPGTIHDAIRLYKASEYVTNLLGESNKQKYLAPKVAVAGRSGRELGNRVKAGEVIYHHEVTNQSLWNSF